MYNFFKKWFSKDTGDKKDITPNEYFEDLKKQMVLITEESSISFLHYLNDAIKDAEVTGQSKLLKGLYFAKWCCAKNFMLVENGYNKYITYKDTQTLIKSVSIEKCIHFTDFNNYPRTVPKHVIEAYKKAKALNVFNRFSVLYTDYSGQETRTVEEKRIMYKNRDPILFGTLEFDPRIPTGTSDTDEEQSYKKYHDHSSDRDNRIYADTKLFFIADWEDEYCDLTFGKMLSIMQQNNILSKEEIEKLNSDNGNIDTEAVIEECKNYMVLKYKEEQEIKDKTQYHKGRSGNTDDPERG